MLVERKDYNCMFNLNVVGLMRTFLYCAATQRVALGLKYKFGRLIKKKT